MGEREAIHQCLWAYGGDGLHNGMGWCYLKLDRTVEARAAFQRALALWADYEDAREGLRQTGE